MPCINIHTCLLTYYNLHKQSLHAAERPRYHLFTSYIDMCKSKFRVQGTHFYGDAVEFDGHRGINLGIWSQWLYHGNDDKLALVVTVASIVTGIMG